ncbi:hypothetical protein ACP4OV_023135 [Aristida adscensionis]
MVKAPPDALRRRATPPGASSGPGGGENAPPGASDAARPGPSPRAASRPSLRAIQPGKV